MKYLIKPFHVLGLLLLSSCFGSVKSKPSDNTGKSSTSSIYDIKVKLIGGEEIDLSRFKGKKMLIVNTASKCGYTPQYDALETLHKKYGDKVIILGFPANNFGGQEPGSNEEIASFCKKNYGVSFLMFEKISVKGSDIHPLYRWLGSKDLNGWNEELPSWNFGKYLISETGEILNFFSSSTNPTSKDIIDAITK